MPLVSSSYMNRMKSFHRADELTIHAKRCIEYIIWNYIILFNASFCLYFKFVSLMKWFHLALLLPFIKTSFLSFSFSWWRRSRRSRSWLHLLLCIIHVARHYNGVRSGRIQRQMGRWQRCHSHVKRCQPCACSQPVCCQAWSEEQKWLRRMTYEAWFLFFRCWLIPMTVQLIWCLQLDARPVEGVLFSCFHCSVLLCLLGESSIVQSIFTSLSYHHRSHLPLLLIA